MQSLKPVSTVPDNCFLYAIAKNDIYYQTDLCAPNTNYNSLKIILTSTCEYIYIFNV